MDLTSLLQSLVPGLLTGGSAAGTTFIGVFKNIRDRILKLEKALGDPDSEPPTGFYYSIDMLTKSVRSLRNEIDSWRDSPPDWLVRMVTRAARGSMTNEHMVDFEQRFESRLNGFKSSLQRLEEDLDRRERRLEEEIGKSSPEFQGIVMREEYDRDSVQRADELRKIRESLKATNSFLRGIMAAMGYVDPEPSATAVPSTPPPPKPPRPGPRVIVPTPGRSFQVPGLPPKKK